mmetsp:Transcript_2902/g.7044  ORF Transcript_2902/g.7044 Transcript_2902/m.7044 type:complete len:205 (+) Transcript_2902:71-685(+)
MGSKRKRIAQKALDDEDRSMFKTFSTAANAVSLMYTQSQSQQRRAYAMGMQGAFEKVLQWADLQGTATSSGKAIRRQALTDFVQDELETLECDSACGTESIDTSARDVSHHLKPHQQLLHSPIRKTLAALAHQRFLQSQQEQHSRLLQRSKELSFSEEGASTMCCDTGEGQQQDSTKPQERGKVKRTDESNHDALVNQLGTHQL